jgi:ABC-type Fe3+ transport system substrate-binding protein
MARLFALRSLMLGLTATAVIGAAPGHAADQATIDAAKKEGEAVWYTTLIVDQLARPMVAGFEKKYPGIKVSTFRANSTDVVIKVINEGKAGRVQADLVDGTSTTGALKKEKLIEQWVPDAVSMYPKYLVDPQRYWVAQNLYVLTPGYNTNLVKPGTQPKTYDDLLDPKWKGKLTWNGAVSTSGGPGFVGTALLAFGQDKGMEYLKKLAEQKIVNRNVSAREVLDQVIAGESAIALQIFNHHAVISAQQGAPVDWIAMEPATVNLQLASITKGAPHPNAAKLMLEYQISEEGQKIFQAADYLPALPSVPAKVAKLKPEGGNFQALYMNPDEIDENLPKWTEIFKQLFR